ncbi:phosphoribosylformylglycinamidine synthase subunit PurQ [Akkermansia glycaniphila]|uniref:phosphoribosylformylglycinamidine synthase subunit PurQ n=1 Tax=Akkermansia glycaniphila TaxID=1679444 RepID=UPI001C02973C|nr:phosphoribosylformylglycinamidine synthase subunit PurQ [Akkermansia glycaniphila]MBT9449390.1 phosphoribosylformylglycinamidine synthase subunit PurQ [Akkermansia glycaniphila]
MAHALLLKYPGTNCDVETERALRTAGFSTQVQPIATARPEHVSKAQLVVFAGGFSYGDYVMSGRLAQLETERFLGDAIHKHHQNGGFLLGICNGFQILTKLGILPKASLIWNKSERFECMWDKLVKVSPSPYTTYLPAEFELPSAHAEGRLVMEPGDAQKYMDSGLVSLQYGDNHNGSELRIAGLQDATGRAMGLMPHPERFLKPQHHYDPDWSGDSDWGWGYYLFKSAFEALK